MKQTRNSPRRLKMWFIPRPHHLRSWSSELRRCHSSHKGRHSLRWGNEHLYGIPLCRLFPIGILARFPSPVQRLRAVKLNVSCFRLIWLMGLIILGVLVVFRRVISVGIRYVQEWRSSIRGKGNSPLFKNVLILLASSFRHGYAHHPFVCGQLPLGMLRCKIQSETNRHLRFFESGRIFDHRGTYCNTLRVSQSILADQRLPRLRIQKIWTRRHWS